MRDVPGLADTVREYRRVRSRLFSIAFVTLASYLELLELCCHCLTGTGRHALLYLAAAVSDFYIAESDLVGLRR